MQHQDSMSSGTKRNQSLNPYLGKIHVSMTLPFLSALEVTRYSYTIFVLMSSKIYFKIQVYQTEVQHTLYTLGKGLLIKRNAPKRR